jgi:hypothetical protein
VKPLIIDEEAELELAGSVAFYEERRSGLGLDFHAAAKEAVRRIATAPERWPVGKHDTKTLRYEQVPVCYSLHRHARQTLDRGIRPRKTKAGILD